MRLLVTGSSGHLGEALVRTLREAGHTATGLDISASPQTDLVGSIIDRGLVRRAMSGVDAVLHTAALHKPHIATHSRQDFVDTNITATLTLLEEALAARVGAFVLTSTTSVFGDALRPPPGSPAAWITEEVTPIPRNIYGVTKMAAEDLCLLFHRNHGLPCIVLRTSRFFPEADDEESRRMGFDDANLKVNELLYRRADMEDMVSAHVAALDAAPRIGFGKFIISATTPFEKSDLAELRSGAPGVVRRRVPGYEAVFTARGWKMLEDIDRVYVNEHARSLLGWKPRYDFARAVAELASGRNPWSSFSQAVRIKGYHQGAFKDGLYPV